MRLELDRHPDPVRHRHPCLNHRHHVVDGNRHDLPDHIDKGRAEIRGHVQRVFEALNRLRERHNQRRQPVGRHMWPYRMGHRHVRRAQINRHAVKPGRRHHLAHLIMRQLHAMLIVRLHRPERGVNLKPPHSAGTRRVRPPTVGTIQTSFIGYWLSSLAISFLMTSI